MHFSRSLDEASLHRSTQSCYSLPEARESVAQTCSVVLLTFLSLPIVEYHDFSHFLIAGQSDQTLLGMAVADDVGHAFPYRPGQNGIKSRGKISSRLFDLILHSRRFEQLSRPIQFVRESRLSVPGDGFAHFVEHLS